MSTEPLVLSEMEKAFVRRLLVSGKKDCCWCETHLKCTYEKKIYKSPGMYCNFWQLSKALRELYSISPEEVAVAGRTG